MFLLLTLVVLAADALVPDGTIHPKLMNQGANMGAAEEGDLPQTFYRIRRQQQLPPAPRQPIQIAGLRQILPALDEIGRSIRSLENKLMRHEYRESQVDDFASKTLSALTADHVQTKSGIAQMAKQLAAVEERVMAILTLVSMSDERQREMITKIGEGLDRLLVASSEPSLGRSPGSLPDVSPEAFTNVVASVQTVARRVADMEANQEAKLREVSNKVRGLHEDITQRLGHLTVRQDGILSVVEACQSPAITAAPSTTGPPAACERLEVEVVGRLDVLTHMTQGNGLLLRDLKDNTATAMGEQQAGLHALLREIRQESTLFNGSFSSILAGLQELEQASRQNLGALHANLKEVMQENDAMIKERIQSMESSIKEGQSNIMGALDDTASMTDNLQTTVSDNYELLSKEIGGLNKVEKVMINTADAVLDTKRSIEFGIQQIILELGDIVSKSGSTINSTLSDQINAISFNILKNQTSALTNMTQRMEGEISQVWRQIGIMYQQVEQSISMLNNLQDTTDQHMNVSLSRVGNMDGTVGEISGKVSDVEDNLNYLLGRLSLVVSEFNHMKAGVGNELDRLRQMAQEFSIPNGNQDSLKYTINKE